METENSEEPFRKTRFLQTLLNDRNTMASAFALKDVHFLPKTNKAVSKLSPTRTLQPAEGN